MIASEGTIGPICPRNTRGWGSDVLGLSPSPGTSDLRTLSREGVPGKFDSERTHALLQVSTQIK